MRTLYLHIGMHRTATSSIQTFLHRNFTPLISRGFLYPLGVRRHFRLFNHIFYGLLDVREVAIDLDKRAAAKDHEIHSVILSDEDICTRQDLSALAPLREIFDVKIIFCLRRQDLWLESWYLQNIKWQWDPELDHLTFDAFLSQRQQFFWTDYKRYIRHLEEVFGRENILPYVFENSEMPEGPVAEFSKRIGLKDPQTLKQPTLENASFGPVMAEFVRNLPLDEAPPPYRKTLEQACRNLDRALGGSRSKLLFTPEARRRVLAEYAKGNAYIARRYFNRKTLFNAPVPGPESEVANMVLPQDSATLMAELVNPFVRELIRLHKPDE